ncbi:hypothetical protein [Bradyrhizobium sp. LA2.1]|uniref:hypothetical protein n=1 Tax=Bradyrhizobium sp. LA2.1 TaxID=3156376 RepID=UPI003390884A
MSISHWGIFEGPALPLQAPLTWICEIARLQSLLAQHAKPAGKLILSGRAIRMINA